MMVLLSLMSGTTIKAQFNTVGHLYNHQVQKKKNPQETNTSSLVDNLMVKDSLKHASLHINMVDSCRENVALSSQTSGDILQYLNMAFPLKSILINSEFGMRRHPVTHKYCMHNGVDLQAHYEPVYSMFSGKVVMAAYDKRSGRYITIQTGRYSLSYCHLSSSKVTMGQYVKAGEIIGVSGNTGMSTGPHLHLTTKKDGKTIDPTILLNCVQTIITLDKYYQLSTSLPLKPFLMTLRPYP